MITLKKGTGCGVRATLLTPSGAVCDLRRARYIAASVVLPDGRTMPCEEISADETTHTVYVRLLAARELTSVGQYGIVFNLKTGDNTMYATEVVPLAEVVEEAEVNYREATLSLSIEVVDFPANVAYTGASPKISVRRTWLVYDDELNAYVDSGIPVTINDGSAEQPFIVQESGIRPDVVMSQEATTRALAGKVDAEAGKGLSTCDFTEALRGKLEGLHTGLVAAPAEATLVAQAGKFYYWTNQASLSVTGVQGFTPEADCAALAVSGNCAVTFGSAFKCQQGIDALEATAAQWKIYTIQRVPVSDAGAILVVNCSIYG